jgi:uncharacterized protein YcbK (DUF882 family)
MIFKVTLFVLFVIGICILGTTAYASEATKREAFVERTFKPAAVQKTSNKRTIYAVAHKKVSTKCLKPKLLKILKIVKKHYGKTPVITSGYRSPAHNKRVRGAKRSKHLSCQAADITVKGVSKTKLAKYLKTIPGRGGVGLYCRSSFVHIDVGRKREWYWGCGKKKKHRHR